MIIILKQIMRNNNKQTKLSQYFSKMEKDRLTQNITNKDNKDNQKIQSKQIDNNKNHNQKDQKKQQKVIQLEVSGSESSSVQISKKSQKKQKGQSQRKNLNVLFYTNKIASIPDGDFIDNFHHKQKKWWGNYKLLQAHHGFIQWLFPNCFQSRFNRSAQPLNEQQIKQFRNNIQIAQRYQTSYMMMLQFYGMKLKCKKSGEITRCRHPVNYNKQTEVNKNTFWEDRYYKTFLTSFHNHMRITRILSSLVICGFGRYARQLSIFLDEEINKPGGGLTPLKKYGIYERQWKEYSQYVERQEQKNILLKNYQKHDKKPIQ